MKPQPLSIVGNPDAVIQFIYDPETGTEYMQIPLHEFLQREARMDDKYTPWYCAVNIHAMQIYISKHKPCKNPTAFMAMPRKSENDLSQLRLPIQGREVRLANIQKAIAAALNMMEPIMKSMCALEGRQYSELLSDPKWRENLSIRDQLNKKIEESERSTERRNDA